MNPDPNQAKALFLEAVEKHAPEAWPAFLDQACAGQPELRQRVEVLLAAHQEAGTAAHQAAEGAASAPSEGTESAAGPGTVIGPYKLVQEIGEGGMGTVWMAQQTEPVKRLVALKLIKPGMDSRQVIARFEAERQALALMDHPNIARVLDAGATDTGRPYFVMELVKGVPITRYCDEHRLTPRERLELFVPVCSAIQHAHQKGIIHRDIKPSNVLVALYDGVPVPKVIDFGVAKAAGPQLTEQTLVTGFGMVVGTLEYMSPEQAQLNQLDIDTRSDLYSLGVLLYELLTGTTPLDRKRLKQAAILEMLRIIREEEPPRPSTRLSTTEQLPSIAVDRGLEPKQLNSTVRGELDWIVMKALEKDRNRRYETANGFAQDIQRYLADEPVQACPPSLGYRLGKFARRNRGRLATAAVLGLALLVGAGSLGWTALERAARQSEASKEVRLALEQAEALQEQSKRAEALAALERAELLLRQAAPDPGRAERLAALKERLAAEIRDQEFITQFEDIRLRAQSQVNVQTGHFDARAIFSQIQEALRHYGLDIGARTPAQAADLIQSRPEPVHRHLVTALQECLTWAPKDDAALRQWMLTVLDSADNDPWRVRVRKAVAGNDGPALAQLAGEADVGKQPPSFLLFVAVNLPPPMKAARLDLLRRIQRAYPADLWANHWLAWELKEAQPVEAIRYFTAALALRPDNPGIYVNRGAALKETGDVDAAIADFSRAVALAPNSPTAHLNLGVALQARGRLDEAIACYRQAIRLDPKFARAHTNLGTALKDRGRLDDAIACYREAIRLQKDNALAHYSLGNALAVKGQLDEAIAAYREAIRLKKDHAEALCNLGHALRRQGAFQQALEALRHGHELGSRDPRWRYPSAQWVRQCERLVELDEQLPNFLAGKTTPASPAERIEVAGLCSLKRLHHAAARFYTDAFTAQPSLADQLGAGHRYNAACAAALAGCGQGKDADKLDDKERARLRVQAQAWLRADLDAWGRLLDKAEDRGRTQILQNMPRWLADTDLAGVRGPEALARLPEAERQAWQKLWDDVADLLARARGKKPQKE
jgi:serine/threonine protein kinase/tetratricopeptide (TPR) repeat protein